MSKIQELFDRIVETKSEIKSIKAMYKDALDNSRRYQEIKGQLEELKAKKKEIEDSIKDDYLTELDKLEILKNDLANDVILITDVAMVKVAKGELIEVVDEYSAKYSPLFSVKFKKN